MSESYFAIPLRIYSGKLNVSSSSGFASLRKAVADGNGLSLATDPTGPVNFLDMVNNLQGDSGRGYYIEMAIGTPGQTVCALMCNILMYNLSTVCTKSNL